MPIKIILLSVWLLAISTSLTGHAAAHTEPLTLAQAIDVALENNPQLSIMQARVEQAEQELSLALANYYPQINVAIAYQHTTHPAEAFALIIAQRRLDFSGMDFNHPGGIDNYRPQLTATYSLYRGGQDSHLAAAAQLAKQASALEQDALCKRLINHITAAYFAQLAASDVHRLSQHAVTAIASELRQTQHYFAAGTVLKSDVLSLQVHLAEAQDAELHAAHAIEIANTLLKTLLGKAVSDTLIIAENLVLQNPKAPSALADLLAKIHTQHPEIQAAEKRIAIAQEHLAAERGAYLPRADAYINYGLNSKNTDFDTQRDNVSVGVQVDVDVFNGFATQAKINKAEHEVAIAKEQARQLRLQIESAVNTAQLNLQDALRRAELAALAVQAADEALRLVNEQRQAGVVTVTRYIEAEVARDKAHTRHITAHYDALRAEAELKQHVF